MSSKDMKQLRSQLRQVVQELFTEELSQKIYKELLAKMQDRMDIVAKGAKETMERIEERQKQMQSIILRSYQAQELKNAKE